MSRLEELQTAWGEASGKHEAVRDARMAFERELLDEVSKKVDGKFRAEECASHNAEAAAERAFRDEENRIRAEGNSAKLLHPEGTVLLEWRLGPWGSANREMGLTGRSAVLQIFKKGDLFPSNVRYRRPRPGDVVLRLIKKDGRPGIAIETVYERHDWFCESGKNWSRWLPQGKEPKLT